MTPSVEIRLASVVHGLRDVIFPAIDPDQSLASEQAGLILAQLTMLLEQLPLIDRYHRLCRDDMAATAAAMAADAAGGAETLAAARVLADATLAPPAGDPRDGYNRIGFAVETLVRAVAHDGADGYRARVEAAALAFGSRQVRRERTWFQAAGFDARPEELGTIAALFADQG